MKEEHLALEVLTRAAANNRLAHAYLFYSSRGVDLEPLVLEAIRLLFSHRLHQPLAATHLGAITYADLQIIRPNADGLITKEQVNGVVNQLYESALTKQGLKILYIQDVEAGNKFSLNALLKFLEEPVPNLVVLMSTNCVDQVITTITSRTQNLYVKPPSLATRVAALQPHCRSSYLVLLANIYHQPAQLQIIDQALFDRTCNEVLKILEQALTNLYHLKPALAQLWTRENNAFVVAILQHFYYQIQIAIDQQFPLFPEHEALVARYKRCNLDGGALLHLLATFQQRLKHHGNFLLQRSYVLAELERLYHDALVLV